jgi:hypothetical protein
MAKKASGKKSRGDKAKKTKLVATERMKNDD